VGSIGQDITIVDKEIKINPAIDIMQEARMNYPKYSKYSSLGIVCFSYKTIGIKISCPISFDWYFKIAVIIHYLKWLFYYTYQCKFLAHKSESELVCVIRLSDFFGDLMSKKRVVVGMSGGVDSSVAAAILKEQGYEPIGVTLVLLPEECESDRPDACCGIKAVDDAREVCHQLGIRYQTFNFRHIFREQIIEYFCSEYNAGKTPNPCTRCNKRIKFPMLIYAADILDAQFIATGHFARIKSKDDSYQLLKGLDRAKDQSYFLFDLDQVTLSRTLFPLGEMTKTDSRRIAEERNLHVHKKPESQEICFIKDNRYGNFFRQQMPDRLIPGPIYNTSGKKIGTHQGIQLYTIGQRRGTRLAHGKPLYVISVDAKTNSIVVGDDADLFADGLIASDMTWQSGMKPAKTAHFEIKIRYNHKGICASATPLEGNLAEVIFDEPQRAIAPGQATVFYNGDVVAGGGWIVNGINRNH
jgi:tRNA-uridine 2-sulfurtransferase